ncbi:hypothetical protein [uncultured Lutibacter sp.]|uniref:hypothetical protein n=1 Tax=uncultured Lutibacter sp. TaxID=437739 RepID=UPI0026281735|nr:hypothetical protein [uncultured Lutibacter sp.]
MKYNIFKHYLITSLIIVITFSFNGFAQELDASNYKMRFNFKTVKQADNSRLLEVEFIGQNKKDRKDKIPVADAEISFYNILNEEEVLLGTAKTSYEGIAKITVPNSQKYLIDDDGLINLIAKFEGSDAIDAEEDEISIKDLILELNLEEIDSVKTVLVKAFTIDSVGVKTPVEEADVIISIQGMLSKMKLKEEYIEDGEYEFEFPNDIPGNENGEITIFSIIEDNDDFGNVFQKKTVNWGTFNKQVKEEGNKLWSEAAPMWMYIVLTILLLGVWANYAYTISYLFKIKKEGKKITENKKQEI